MKIIVSVTDYFDDVANMKKPAMVNKDVKIW